MAKTLVIDNELRTQVPFLRGILTRSLQDAGVPFKSAYALASTIRNELRDADTITNRDLQATVLVRLRRMGRREESVRYRRQRHAGESIVVEENDGRTVAFSRAVHERGLACCGISAEEIHRVTQRLYEHLIEEGTTTIPVDRLGGLTYGCLRREVSEAAAQRYLVWTSFVRSGRPLIVLIGGTAGCGKSTTASMLASRLDIVRTQSTDMLREIMRVMIPERLLPALHRSSFDAWRALPGHDHLDECSDSVLADGYRTQADLLSVATEAVVQRALRERVSLVLEGVHVTPSFADKIPRDDDAVIVTVMLAVLDSERLRRYIRGRGGEVPQRRAERYINRFGDIWRLQSYLLAEADRAHVAIIQNDDPEEVFRKIMVHVIDGLSSGFTPTARDVFGGRIRQLHQLLPVRNGDSA